MEKKFLYKSSSNLFESAYVTEYIKILNIIYIKYDKIFILDLV